MDLKTGTVTRSPPSRGFPQAFHVDSRGNVWIGTDSGGLYCLPAGRPPARQWTVDDGLPSNNISFVMGDEAGHIWVGTTRGITRVQDGTRLPVKPQLLRFGVEDGLQGSEFKRGAAFRSSTGEMFFGGLAEIKTLSGLLPICAWCKKIRDDDGCWNQIETFVKDRTEADFTHGICPECAERVRSARPSRPSP